MSSIQFFFSKSIRFPEQNRISELVALCLFNKVLPALEERNVRCVFLDNSACFGTLPLSIIYKKFERYVLSDVILYFNKGIDPGKIGQFHDFFFRRKRLFIYNGWSSPKILWA